MPALILDDLIRHHLADLKKRAEENPVNILEVAEKVKTPEGKTLHMAQMNAQSVEIPVGFFVTYSVEEGQPIGICRHMSMSVDRAGKMPHPAAIWMIAKELGFWGESMDVVDAIWKEDLKQGPAINIIQRMVKN